MEIRKTIEKIFLEVLSTRKSQLKNNFHDDLILLESGLDSLGFAILVAKLEDELKYDPFQLMDTPYYPKTYKEFVDIYIKYAPKK